jgi:DNA invertase Pin-like site-specific DNA recombinase
MEVDSIPLYPRASEACWPPDCSNGCAEVPSRRFDRFTRSTKHLVLALEEFQALAIDFISLNESVDTSTPMGKMIFTVLGAVAELERFDYTGEGSGGRRPCEASRKALRTAYRHRGSSPTRRDEGRRPKYQSHRERMRHRPRHGSQHPRQGGRKWFRHR